MNRGLAIANSAVKSKSTNSGRTHLRVGPGTDPRDAPGWRGSGNASSTRLEVYRLQCENRIYRDAAHFDGVSNWLIGGYGDEFSNVLIGHRGVIRVRGNHVKVVGNFINPQYPLTSPDVENIVVGSDDAAPDLVMEHNVLRSGEWVLRECQGEVRYNLIADMNGHAWIKGPHDCNVHHNIFVNYDTPDPNREAGGSAPDGGGLAGGTGSASSKSNSGCGCHLGAAPLHRSLWGGLSLLLVAVTRTRFRRRSASLRRGNWG